MKTKFVLSGGVITKSKEEGRDFLDETIKGFSEPVRLLDCLFSRPIKTWEKIFLEDIEFYKNKLPGVKFTLELANPDKFSEQVKNSDVIYLRGGSTKKLLELLKKDLTWIKFLDGKTIAGTSAGTDAVSKYYSDLDKKGVCDGLGLLNIKIIVHWESDYNFGKINWEDRLKELNDFQKEIPLYKLKEGEFIVLHKEK